MSTYYVSNQGSDNNNGTSINAPWRSTGKVSSAHLNPGDQVLFQGGQTFNGGLEFYDEGGSGSNPIVVSSYGSGRATISSGTGKGAWVLNTTGITFKNLIFVGKPGDTYSQDGIRIENYTGNSVRSGFTVTGCDISGYAEAGIDFGSDNRYEGLNNVTITNNNIHDNVETGVESWCITTESNTNVYIAHNLVHNNYGDGKRAVTGSGLMLQGLNGSTIEYNSAYDNGAIGGSGAVGIWCYLSNAVVMQYNQSYDNKTRSNDDGDGFDFDADTSNSIMQYNLAYGNDGGGFQLNQWHNNNLETGDIIRYNISQNNGRKNNYSGIDVWGKVLNAQIYNNTVYNSPAQNGQDSDLRISNNETGGLLASNIYVANNIFVSTGGTPLVDMYAGSRGSTNVQFAGNVYYSYSGGSNFVWAGKQYTSLDAWRSATGQEKLNGQAVGAYANPMLNSPGNAVAESVAYNPAGITAYNLQPGTPILSAGIPLNNLFTIASPLTGNTTSRTIPGVDQSLASGSPFSSGGSSGSSGGSTSGGSSSGGTSSGGTSSSGSGTSTSSSGTVGSSSLTGWDIGSPNAGGNSSNGNSDIVTAGGSGLLGNSDSFRYAFTTLSGNGQIVAQVASLSDTNPVAKAGLMIRSANTANAAAVSMLLSPNNTASLTARSTTGATTSTVNTVADSGDQWVKLVRSGNTFSGYISANGVSWTLVSTTNVTMGTSVYIGLAVSAGAMGSLETASYKNVSVT